MKLGFAVKVVGEGGLPSHDARRWRSGPHLGVSLGYLRDVLAYLERIDVRMYRMATALAPYASHPDMPQFWNQVDECAAELADVGRRALERDVRLSTHPGQYTVLNSTDERVMGLAVRELDAQAALFDAMRLPPEAVIVTHLGGAAGGIAAAKDRFLRGFERLSPAAQQRLAVENDDRSFGIADVVDVARRTGRPAVWDILHHHCHDPHRIPDRDALEMALTTWSRGVTPKIHFSSPRTLVSERRRKVGRKTITDVVLPQLRAHADLVDPISFEQFLLGTGAGLHFDVMLEAKAKDLALLGLRDHLRARGLRV
jgi:UV DNA damage endonuclease